MTGLRHSAVPASPRTITALMACHNRREATVRCLTALARQIVDAKIAVVLVADGSTDDTQSAAAAAWPGLTIIQGDGTLYWAKSMSIAEKAAQADSPKFLLWLNDDVMLDETAVQRMLRVHDAHSQRHPIVVGTVRDPITCEPTYGGRRRLGRHPQRLRPVVPTAEVQDIDTFNGNVVLVPTAASLRIGPIDGAFPHAYADDDYGLRARSVGIPVLLAPGTVGTCRSNDPQIPAGSVLGRWRQLQEPKGLPWRAQVRFYRRHAGPEWPIYLLWAYARRLLVSRTRHRRRTANRGTVRARMLHGVHMPNKKRLAYAGPALAGDFPAIDSSEKIEEHLSSPHVGKCPVCAADLTDFSEGVLFERLPVRYFRCTGCGLILLPNPTWLDDAYSEAISSLDIGLLMRCRQASRDTSRCIRYERLSKGRFLDWAGGYGTLTRLLRDAGLDFRHWDPLCKNIFAQGYEGTPSEHYDLVTAFEVVEHLADPYGSLHPISRNSDRLLFTTYLLPTPAPYPGEWWYYAAETGQHITFHTHRSLEILADRLGYKLLTNGVYMHLFYRGKVHWLTRCLLSPQATRLRSVSRRVRAGVGRSANAGLLEADAAEAVSRLRTRE